ncbi:pentapeptide repeat-containing protein [Geomonas subterranea]|uniref:Pentapeptide repeat-containing protein n=1 Tax=Geomonas subterranea TaxID=2847989 RepID=A0ABX8LGN4_9BACT|nr:MULTISPECIES: pentapeptide repeat-containing protein [Geomonas]QXE89860.1 pentapeptide repeat-containing protein [Geomonas subterranea]QXM08022.1 pentapeptide repeat-containing protein [Geomonas subterranea]
MNRYFAPPIACFTMAFALWAGQTLVAAQASAAGPEPAKAAKERAAGDSGENAAEALKLKLAEAKLAALAKESELSKPAAQVTKKGAGKKNVKGKLKKAKGGKKGTVAAKGKKGKGGGAAVAGKVLDRRMTPAEVQGILAGSRDFSGTDLSGLNLNGYDLSGAKFNRAKLQSVNLERADLSETDLELADLSGADLRGASLNQARLRGTRLAGAKLDGALWTDKTICRSGSVGNCIE